jgi:hypothetical protein
MSEELVEAKNTVVLLAKVTPVKRPIAGRREGVELMPQVSQLMVEGFNRGVLLSNRANKLQGGEVESVAGGLVEFHRMLPHCLNECMEVRSIAILTFILLRRN